MKPSKFLPAFFTLFFVVSVSAQTPGGINYQGRARGAFLTPIIADSIYLRFTIREKTVNGQALYHETRKTITDSFGVFHVVIGSGGAMVQSGNIKSVNWGDSTKKFLQVEMKVFEIGSLPDFIDMGTTAMLSVPFSFYSDLSDRSGSYFFRATIPPNYFQSIPNAAVYTVSIPRVLENDGNVYDSVTSAFTAPDTGIYHFDITAAHLLDENQITNPSQYWSESAQVVLVRNTTFVKLLHEESHFGNAPVPDTKGDQGVSYFNTSVTLKLNKNDKVSIQLFAQYINFTNYRLGYTPGNDPLLHAEFSGYRVK